MQILGMQSLDYGIWLQKKLDGNQNFALRLSSMIFNFKIWTYYLCFRHLYLLINSGNNHLASQIYLHDQILKIVVKIFNIKDFSSKKEKIVSRRKK